MKYILLFLFSFSAYSDEYFDIGDSGYRIIQNTKYERFFTCADERQEKGNVCYMVKMEGSNPNAYYWLDSRTFHIVKIFKDTEHAALYKSGLDGWRFAAIKAKAEMDAMEHKGE